MASSLRSVLWATRKPLVWYSGAGISCGRCSGRSTYTLGIGFIAPRTYSPGAGATITLGRPVDPLDAIAAAGSATASGSGSVDRAVLARTSSRTTTGTALSAWSPTSSTAPATPSRRSRSQAGRSARTGSTPAPTFQAPIATKKCSGELTRATATQSPGPAPRSARRRATWVERASSSPQEISRSSASTGAKTIAVVSGCRAARSVIRRPNGTGSSTPGLPAPVPVTRASSTAARAAR